MQTVTIAVKSDVDVQNAGSVLDNLKAQITDLPKDTDISLTTGEGPPSVLSEQLAFACARTLLKTGHRVTLDDTLSDSFAHALPDAGGAAT